jgi:UDP-glucose 4-epimerase
MKILLTGGAGFIGSHLAEAFIAAGHQVVIVDKLSTGRAEYLHPAADFYQMDICSDDLPAVFERERPEVVCHHAAQMSVLVSLREPLLDAQTNILGSLNLLTCAQNYGARAFIFASSGGTVYGDAATLPTPESAPLLPLSPYGLSKMSFEHYLRLAAMTSPLQISILRYANVYGERQSPHGEAGVIAIFTEKMLRGEVVSIYGDGEQSRDFIYVGDVVRANLAALERPEPLQTFNIGTGRPTTVNQIFAHLAKLTHYPHSPEWLEVKAGEVRHNLLDIRQAGAHLGWAPEMPLAEGLARTVAAYR